MVEVTTWSVNWSERENSLFPVFSCNESSITFEELTFSSSDESVATYDGESVYLIAPGTTTITASFAGNTNYSAASASYTLTVVDDRTELAASELGFASATATATYGGTVTAPALTNSEKLSFTWNSSVPTVATVNTDGAVTIVGAGETTISAAFAGNENYKPKTVSYSLTVAQKEVGLTWGTVSFTYDGSAHVPTATATGLVGADACTVTVDGAQTNAGSYTATASALSNANYKLPAANTTTFTIAKAASSLTTAPTAKTLTYTGSAQALVNAGTASGGTLQYSLDNQTYVEAIPTGTNVGNYTVYYKVVGDANHEDAAGSQVTVTIAKATPTVTFSAATASAKMGESFTAPTATTTPAGLALTYASSATNVATVNASTGAVTLVAAGTATITATFAGNDNYNTANASYTLTVSKADAVEATLSFASTTATATYGGTVSAPALTNPQSLPLTWTSSNQNVATVGTNGAVTVVGAGETTISAAFAGNDDYKAKTVSYTLTVAKATPTVTFSAATASAKMGESFTAPTATTTPAGLALTYASSATNVATVNASTGAVTLVAAGTATITATFAGNDNYNTANASYTLTVSKADPEPEPLATWIGFEKTEVTAVLGEPFTAPRVVVAPSGLPLTFTSSHKGVATVNESTGEVTLVRSGTTRITASFEGDDSHAPYRASYRLKVLGALIRPITQEEDYSMMDSDDFTNNDGTEKDLSNTVINDILYTLKNLDSDEGDGYDPDLQAIILNTNQDLADLMGAIKKGVVPCTPEFAAAFTGLTFLVPAGEGHIVVTSQELNGSQLMVKVGDDEPVSGKNSVAISMSEMGDYNIPYQSAMETWVYLYKSGKSGSGTRGKKTAADVRIRNVSYKKLASGISDVVSEQSDDAPWYDLSGQRISKPVKKGLYIHGNRKVVVK